jgi:dimeric dUTPase (all-alpha-NTP-PPase superfamily)
MGNTLNLKFLFEQQGALDFHIAKEQGIKTPFENKVLAIIVEAGECANEWQGFKTWKRNREPKANTLGEFIDILHFILSVGLDIGIDPEKIVLEDLESHKEKDLVNQFIRLSTTAGQLKTWRNRTDWCILFHEYLALAEMFGFKWSEIVNAYLHKNNVNHERQRTGY